MTLDEYIIRNAERGGDEGFLRRFNTAEVFFSLDSQGREELQETASVSSEAGLSLQVVTLDIGRMGLFYATKDDRRLNDRFAGMPLIRAAQMVCDLPDVDGMLIQSSGDAWFVARKAALQETIGQVRDQVFFKDFPDPPSIT